MTFDETIVTENSTSSNSTSSKSGNASTMIKGGGGKSTVIKGNQTSAGNFTITLESEVNKTEKANATGGQVVVFEDEMGTKTTSITQGAPEKDIKEAEQKKELEIKAFEAKQKEILKIEEKKEEIKKVEE